MRPINRAGIALVAVLVAVMGLRLIGVSAAHAEITTTFQPVADAFVDATRPRANFGKHGVLRADVRPVKKAFIRFSVTVDGPVNSATLRLFNRSADGGLRISPVADQSWGERRVTYRNAPSHGATIASSSPRVAGTWRSFDVTAQAQTAGRISFAVLARDASGVSLGSRESARSPQLVVEHQTSPPSSPPVRGLFRDGDINLATVGSLGFNTVTVNPYPEDLDELSSAGLNGLVWLGGYDSALCEFRRHAGWVTERLEEVGSHPAIHSFFIDDEPHADCPNVRQQMINRSQLVKTLVPGAITVLTENRGQDFDTLANTTDVLGIIVYPCSHVDGCVFSKIDERIAQAEAAGVEHYWGAPQSFGDEYYKVPTVVEQVQIFEHWNASNMEGYLGYAWSSHSDPETLDTHPELWDAWIAQNSTSPIASPLPSSNGSGDPSPTPSSASPPSSDPVIAAAGDIACAPGSTVTAVKCRHQATSDLVFDQAPDAVLSLGDHQYEDGTLAEFMAAYDPTWGRFKGRTYPTPGNHEYHAPGAPGYFAYFGDRAGTSDEGYYSFDLGTWHLVSLNYYVPIGTSSEQLTWLKQDLAADDSACTLAFMHRARFSSSTHGAAPGAVPAWTALDNEDADVMLAAHDHTYERFAPQDPSGSADASGIREFVVGTGGAELYSFASIAPNSQFRYNSTSGVLFMTLHPTGYDWEYRSESGTVIDSGTGTCT
jgi:hypothetical protein